MMNAAEIAKEVARTVMTKAWKRYRAAYGSQKKFFRDCFREALRLEWKIVRFAREDAALQAKRDRRMAEQAADRPVRFFGKVVERPMSEMEARIDALKYLSFRHDIARIEREIRAQYPTAEAA